MDTFVEYVFMAFSMTVVLKKSLFSAMCLLDLVFWKLQD